MLKTARPGTKVSSAYAREIILGKEEALWNESSKRRKTPF